MTLEMRDEEKREEGRVEGSVEMSCRGIEGYAEKYAFERVIDQQKILIKRLLQRGISIEEIANISCASVNLVREVQKEIEKE